MQLANILANTAQGDIELLNVIKSQGDNATIARELEFSLISKCKEDAENAASFIQKNHFGETKLFEVEGNHVLFVFVKMPLQMNAVLSVSGFMSCVSNIFNLQYDGWATDISK